jgi:hydroxymethylpyrimidine/phosphomethylpyrimidine kinase
MAKAPKLPIALTIAGSDSGGGAGIQADLKTFAALHVHGTSAITCLTAQNPVRVSLIQPSSLSMIRAQIDAVFQELPPGAVKCGMLFTAAIVRCVASYFRSRNTPLVVDPVLVATSNARLTRSGALKALKEELLPRAALATPNLFEAEALTGLKLRDVEDLRAAARKIHNDFGCAALVKGGHLPQSSEASDIYYDGQSELLLTAPYIKNLHTHGTGCTYSAAITGYLARGFPLEGAVVKAKTFITRAIAEGRYAAAHHVLVPPFTP